MNSPFELLHSELPNATMLLEASAGTGKTFTITGIVLRLLLEQRVAQLSEILVVTFTNAATQELKGRIRKALQKAKEACERGSATDPIYNELAERHGEAGAKTLRAALQQCDEMSVATIHSFCKRVLEESAFSAAMPFRTDFVEDDVPLLIDAAEDALRLELLVRDAIASAIARHSEITPETLIGWHRTYRQHEDTKLLPEPQPLADALGALRETLCELRDLAQSGGLPEATLRNLPWKTGPLQKVPASMGAAMFPTLLAMLQSPDAPDFEWILAFATATLRETTIKKESKHLDYEHVFFRLCSTVERRLGIATHALRAALLESMQVRLARSKQQSDSVTFDDLLTRIDDALWHPEQAERLCATIRQRWKVAIIDEFQDTDPVQYRVFAKCFRERSLFLVGDPKQSIYGFRGADVRAYLDARKDAASTHTLAKNHRSHPDLVRAVGGLFRGPGAFAQDGIQMPQVTAAFSAEDLATEGIAGAALQLRCIDSETLKGESKELLRDVIAIDIAHEILRLLEDKTIHLREGSSMRRLRPSDFAVLTRTNDEAQSVQQRLREVGVHSAIGRAGNIYECREYREIRTLLVALTHAHRVDSVRAAWTTSLFGRDADWLLGIDRDENALMTELQRFDQLRRTWSKHGFLAMLESLLTMTDARSRLLRLPDGERRMTNILQVGELLHHAEHERQLRGDGLLRYMERLQRNAAAVESDLKELRLESDDDAVKIQTAHGSKGLQYEIVFAPFHWAGREEAKNGKALLARQDDGSYVYDFDSDDWQANRRRNEEHELEESLRLFYVAITRSKRRCIVHLAANKNGARTAPGWLLLGPGRSPTLPSQEERDQFFDGSKATAAQWIDAAARIATESNGCVSTCSVDGASVLKQKPKPRRANNDEHSPTSSPRALPIEVTPAPRHTSYTSLIKKDRRAAAEVEEVATDARVADEADAAPAEETPSPQCKGFFAFARGADAGNCLHELFERLDFGGDHATTRALVDETLCSHGLASKSKHRGALDPIADTTSMVATLLQKELPKFGFKLADLGKKQRRAEWRFQMRARDLRPSLVADVFARHGGEDFRDYATSLRTLPQQALEGYLSGSIDLLLEHDGRYYVIDWKSNHLGNRAEDYNPSALIADAKKNDYALQWSIYMLAAHRHLRERLPDYDVSRIGGACYVYLRGVDANHENTGFVTFQPQPGFLDAMDRWLGCEEAQ